MYGNGNGIARRFSILGTLQVDVDGVTRHVTAGKARVVVATLLFHANETVSTERLVECIWETPPAAARATLYSMVRRLRQAFGGHDVIRTVDSGYLIEAAPEELDFLMLHRLLDEAGRARDCGDAPAERAVLAEVMALWRGPALSDVPSPALHRTMVPRLEELRLETITREIDLDLTAGKHVRLVSQLRGLTHEHPLREGFWSRLMLALYRCHRQAEALDTYHQVRRLLDEELGVEPCAELRHLQQAILTADPALDLPAPAEILSPVPETWPDLCQLPPLGDFVGRETEQESLVGCLTDVGEPNVVVLWGMVGMGKSELAVQVAHSLRNEYPDGQWYVPLNGSGASPASPADVLADLLIAIGVPPASLPRSADARAAALRARICGRRVLLVLDDAKDFQQVKSLIPGTSSSAVLITSRSALAELPKARRRHLAALSPEASIRVLDTVVSDERTPVETNAARRLVEVCAGLPLALRIVSAKLHARRGCSLAALAERLNDDHRRLDELAVGTLTVRAALAPTCSMLEPDARRAFAAMGLLGLTEFPAWALETLAGRGGEERLAGQLTDAGLYTSTYDEYGELRCQSHGLVTLYARELAAAGSPGELADAIERLLDLLIAAYRPTGWILEGLPADPPAPGAHPIPASLSRLTMPPERWPRAERELLLAAVEQGRRSGHLVKARRLAELVTPERAGLLGPQCALAG